MSARPAFAIDHNITGLAIASLGFFESTSDILDIDKTEIPEIETLRYIIREVDAQRATLVYSDTILETLRRLLVNGGTDFDAIDEESALAAVNLLRALSQASGGFVTDEAVRNTWTRTRKIVDPHFGYARGQVDKEDVFVLSTVIASGLKPVVITQDLGIHNCAGVLAARGVGVMDSRRFNRAVNAA